MKEMVRRGVVSKVGFIRPTSAYVHVDCKPVTDGYPLPMVTETFAVTPQEASRFKEGDRVVLTLEHEPS